MPANGPTPGMREAYNFVAKLNEIILYPLIMLLMGLALLVFLWGCFQYISHGDQSEARATGKKHIMWGIVGMFIMLMAYAILSIAAGTFGVDDELDCANDPLNANCIDSSLYNLPTSPNTNPNSNPF